jgi:hypothetical protein
MQSSTSTPANLKYVGWDETVNNSFNVLFDKAKILEIQNKITQLLEGVEPSGRPILVPTNTIISVLFQCYESNTPIQGDLYSRYIQPDYANRDDLDKIVNNAINIIVSHVRTDYGTLACNRRLSIWNTVLGDFNKEGLRAHPQIKLRKKRPEPMQFNMNY